MFLTCPGSGRRLGTRVGRETLAQECGERIWDKCDDSSREHSVSSGSSNSQYAGNVNNVDAVASNNVPTQYPTNYCYDYSTVSDQRLVETDPLDYLFTLKRRRARSGLARVVAFLRKARTDAQQLLREGKTLPSGEDVSEAAHGPSSRGPKGSAPMLPMHVPLEGCPFGNLKGIASRRRRAPPGTVAPTPSRLDLDRVAGGDS